MDNAVDEGFITPPARHIIVSAQTAQDLISNLEVHTHTYINYNIFTFFKQKYSLLFNKFQPPILLFTLNDKNVIFKF